MAHALKLFIKEMSKAYAELDSPTILAVYDPKVLNPNKRTAKSATSRKLALPAQNIAQEMRSMFAKNASYQSLSDLICDRTEQGTSVASAVERESWRIIEELQKPKNTATVLAAASNNRPWGAARLSAVTNSDFQTLFNNALEADGLAYNIGGFWNGIDAITETIVYADTEADCYLITACQWNVIEAFLLASLEGARDYRSALGICLNETPIAQPLGTSTSAATARRAMMAKSPRAQLQPIVFSGPNPKDYRSETDGIQRVGAGTSSIYSLDGDHGARIGRGDAEWCGESSWTPVLSDALNVSRHHCEISYRDGAWAVSDVGTEGMGSTHGTLVYRADKTRESVFLKDGETVLHHGDFICLSPYHAAPGMDGSCFTWSTEEKGVNFRFETL